MIGVQLRDPSQKPRRVLQLVQHRIQQIGVAARGGGDGGDPPHLHEALVEAQLVAVGDAAGPRGQDDHPIPEE